jgi:hypothetical protein
MKKAENEGEQAFDFKRLGGVTASSGAGYEMKDVYKKMSSEKQGSVGNKNPLSDIERGRRSGGGEAHRNTSVDEGDEYHVEGDEEETEVDDNNEAPEGRVVPSQEPHPLSSFKEQRMSTEMSVKSKTSNKILSARGVSPGGGPAGSLFSSSANK